MARRRGGEGKGLNDGAIHALVTLALVPVTFVAGYLVGPRLQAGPPLWCAGVAALGCLCGVLISPDLDQDGWTFAEMIWFRIPVVGWALGYAWSFVWYPYAAVMPHRGLSHWPIVGTATRVAYLLALNGLGMLLWHRSALDAVSGPALGLWCVGLAISDLGHVARDWWGDVMKALWTWVLRAVLALLAGCVATGAALAVRLPGDVLPLVCGASAGALVLYFMVRRDLVAVLVGWLAGAAGGQVVLWVIQWMRW